MRRRMLRCSMRHALVLSCFLASAVSILSPLSTSLALMEAATPPLVNHRVAASLAIAKLNESLNIADSDAIPIPAVLQGPLVQTSPTPSLLALKTRPSSGADPNKPPRSSFPRNLHRVYDGTWEIVSGPDIGSSVSASVVSGSSNDLGPSSDVSAIYTPPFSSVPVSGATNLTENNQSLVRSNITSEFSFDKQSGFALLSAENKESSLGDDINVVVGELLIRDGAYRSGHDVTFRLIGVYEWSVGRIVVVGDLVYGDVQSLLRRLFASFEAQHSSTELAALAARNITEESFISSLTPVFVRHRNQFRNQLGPTVNNRPSVPGQCPFSATLSIKPGSFADKLPATNSNDGSPRFASGDMPSPPPAGAATGLSSGGLLVGAGLAGRSSLSIGTRQVFNRASDIDTSTTTTRYFSSIGSDITREDAGAFRPLSIEAVQLLGLRNREEKTDPQNVQQDLPLYTVASSPGNDEANAQDEFVEMVGVLDADACGTHLNLVLSTLDTETLFSKAINYTLLVTFVAFVQVIVLIRQMEMTSTQAGASKVSLMTVGLQAVADSYLCLGHLTMGIAVPTLFNAFATAAFFKFIIFSIFEMRYMLLIWKARRPSGFTEGWEAMRRELSMLYSRFYGSLLIGIVLLYQLQNHLVYFLFALYSFWLPQILLSVIEDHRKPLHPLYILGMSVTRLAIPLYFWGCPHNFLHIQPQYVTVLGLVLWVVVQACVLLSQHKFGPRWFIPKPLLPKKYDYFRVVDGSTLHGSDYVDLEAGMTSVDGEALAGSGGRSDGARAETGMLLPRKEVECVICMTPVQIASRDRMVTPCNHFFHSACLEQWLNVKLECAVCRTAVPPP